MEYVIQPLQRDNAAGFFDFFDNRAFADGSPFAPCYCNCFHLTPEELDGVKARADVLGGGFEGTKAALRESAAGLIERGVLQGYLVFQDGIAVGWCNTNDQQSYVRVGSFDPWKQNEGDYYISPGERGKIKSLVCFEIAPGFRGKGIAKALLERVCIDAEADGFAAVEVYAQETEKFSELDFTGPAAMYRKAGFQEVERRGNTVVMQKKLR